MSANDLVPPDPSTKPSLRGDCLEGGVNEARPCQWVTCRYHLYNKTHSCALDVADEGPNDLEVIGDIMGLTRERIRQIEATALWRLKRLPLLKGL